MKRCFEDFKLIFPHFSSFPKIFHYCWISYGVFGISKKFACQFQLRKKSVFSSNFSFWARIFEKFYCQISSYSVVSKEIAADCISINFGLKILWKTWMEHENSPKHLFKVFDVVMFEISLFHFLCDFSFIIIILFIYCYLKIVLHRASVFSFCFFFWRILKCCVCIELNLSAMKIEFIYKIKKSKDFSLGKSESFFKMSGLNVRIKIFSKMFPRRVYFFLSLLFI